MFMHVTRQRCGVLTAAQIRRRILTALLIALVTVGLASACQSVSAALSDSQSSLSNSLIRLHVVANSDTFEDQELKLEVRDAIIDATSALLDGVTNKDEALATVSSSLESLRTVALDTVRAHGYTYDVSVSCARSTFPDRVYGSLYVPAGEYDAVRVVIGDGNGCNWWCVIFPPLCFIDISGEQVTAQAAQSAGGSSSQSEQPIADHPDDDKERLQSYLQSYVSAQEDETDTGKKRTGLIARLEGEIGKLTWRFASQGYALPALPWFF
jgi:stage II sporulation protein R